MELQGGGLVHENGVLPFFHGGIDLDVGEVVFEFLAPYPVTRVFHTHQFRQGIYIPVIIGHEDPASPVHEANHRIRLQGIIALLGTDTDVEGITGLFDLVQDEWIRDNGGDLIIPLETPILHVLFLQCPAEFRNPIPFVGVYRKLGLS